MSLCVTVTHAFIPCSLRHAQFSRNFVPLTTSSNLCVSQFDDFEEDNIIDAALEQKNSKISKNVELRKKIITESIAPWRALRVFAYGALGSGAALGGFITLAGVAAALSGARSNVDLKTEGVNLAIDFGAVALFAVLAKFDLDKGAVLENEVEAKLGKKQEIKEISKAMKKREQELANLNLSLRLSPDGQATQAPVRALQDGARQHLIIVAGPRKAVKDALLGANLIKMEDFAMNNILVVPYQLGSDRDAQIRPSGGFNEKPVWETRSYVAEAVGEGWDEYIAAEMADAEKQSGTDAKEKGIAIIVGNNGKVVRRGVGMIPWRQTVEQLNELNAKKDDDY